MAESTTLTPKQLREAEVAQYEQNIALYESIIATLPTAWPDHLIGYRSTTNQHETIANIDESDDVELLSKLWYADECAKFIKTETLEMTKAKAILAVL